MGRFFPGTYSTLCMFSYIVFLFISVGICGIDLTGHIARAIVTLLKGRSPERPFLKKYDGLKKPSARH